MRRVLFAGGATGGHLFPALALARALTESASIDPVFLVGESSLARSILEPERVRQLTLPTPAKSPLAGIGALRRSMKVLDDERIDAVIALGGRPGVIPGLWARWRRRPLFLLEQNRVLGRANRLLLPCAERIFLSFDETEPALRLREQALRLGCPVRSTFRPTPLPEGDRILLVLGGSQGAQAINELVPQALEHANAPWRIFHVCGAGKEAALEETYRRLGLLATVRPFLQDPSGALSRSALVVARAGGSTIAELTAVGRGSLLLPYPHHKDRHQFHNADALVSRGAAELVPDDATALAARLDALAESRVQREAMAEAAGALGRPDAAARIADVIITHLDLAAEPSGGAGKASFATDSHRSAAEDRGNAQSESLRFAGKDSTVGEAPR